MNDVINKVLISESSRSAHQTTVTFPKLLLHLVAQPALKKTTTGVQHLRHLWFHMLQIYSSMQVEINTLELQCKIKPCKAMLSGRLVT